MKGSDGDGAVRSLGILGGGTAGYLAALALARRVPGLTVTLIESSAVPVIGVGEATTPLMPQFLHADLGLDPGELFAAVRPTLKLGIRFLWGPPEGDFNYPFGPVRPLEATLHDGDPRTCSLASRLMTADRVAAERTAAETTGGWRLHLGRNVAYHLDNRRFVAYLRDRALEAGVRRIDARIEEVERDPEGGIATLVAADGRRFAFDLYVDASGFRSLLLGQTLGSPFVSYAASLPTDTAVVAEVPGNDVLRPYTTARTMRAGWCWSTPQEGADHRGYVFSSDFATPEEAEAEMRRRCPEMGAARLVRFAAGRRRHFWHRNVVALGNAYGFVEPLESTALHLLIRQLGLLLTAFPLGRRERARPERLNRRVAGWWDYLRFFLALHYRFNRRLDTPFWRAAAEVELGDHGELVEEFRRRGPLARHPRGRTLDLPDPLWGPEGIDLLLIAQGVEPASRQPRLERPEWEELQRRYDLAISRAAAHRELLAALRQDPALAVELARPFCDFGPAYTVDPRPPSTSEPGDGARASRRDR